MLKSFGTDNFLVEIKDYKRHRDLGKSMPGYNNLYYNIEIEEKCISSGTAFLSILNFSYKILDIKTNLLWRYEILK